MTAGAQSSIADIVTQYGRPIAVLALYAFQHQMCSAYGPLRQALVEALPEELEACQASDLADELIETVRRHIQAAESASDPRP